MSLIGSTYTNNKGLKFIVEDATKIPHRRDYRYSIRFLDSGYKVDTDLTSIKRGEIKDRLSPSVAGVGYIGYFPDVKSSRAYRVWVGMLNRCYNSKDSAYHKYGLKGVTVCARWHSLENFVEDLKSLPGYNKKLYDEGKLELDKDLINPTAKLYSPETCTLLSKSVNSSLANQEESLERKRKDYVGYPPNSTDGIRIHGLKKFCRENNISARMAFMQLKGELSHVQGWRFERI